MDAFTYVKRVGDLGRLKRIVENLEACSPTMIKYVALRTIGLAGKGGNEDDMKAAREIAGAVEAHVEAIGEVGWGPAEIVSLAGLFAATRRQLSQGTRRFLNGRLQSFKDFSLYDLVQLLRAAGALGLRLDGRRLVAHVAENVQALLRGASVKNVCSLLHALRPGGLRLPASALARIVEHVGRLDARLGFKELTNLFNSLARNVPPACLAVGPEADLDSFHSVMESLYGQVLLHIKAESDDFEGLVDVLDGLVHLSNNDSKLSNHCPDNGFGHSELAHKCTLLINRLKCHFRDDLEPKLVRVLVKSLCSLSYHDEELTRMLFYNYRANSSKWSLQGNLDILRALTLFGAEKLLGAEKMAEFKVEDWLKLVKKFESILNRDYAGKIFILLAMYSCTGCVPVAAIDSLIRAGFIDERRLILATMIFKLNDPLILGKLSLKSLGVLNALDPPHFARVFYQMAPKRFRPDEFASNGFNFVKFCNFNFI